MSAQAAGFRVGSVVNVGVINESSMLSSNTVTQITSTFVELYDGTTYRVVPWAQVSGWISVVTV